MNRSEMIGRITKDLELETTNSGTSVVKFSIAVDRKYRGSDGNKIADFFNIVAWHRLAENICKYCKKGSKVFVAGELQNRSWDKQDGTKGYATEIIASECEFLDSRTESTQAPAEFEPIDDDDRLPF